MLLTGGASTSTTLLSTFRNDIQYHTASNNYSSDAGATVGQAYGTSQYRKIITKVEVLLNPLVGADGYLVRLGRVERRQLH